jgi:hypothetical protein
MHRERAFLKGLFALLATVDVAIAAGMVRYGWPTYLQGRRLSEDTIQIESVPVPFAVVDIVVFSVLIGLHLLLPYLWYRNRNSRTV